MVTRTPMMADGTYIGNNNDNGESLGDWSSYLHDCKVFLPNLSHGIMCIVHFYKLQKKILPFRN
jgi:hypothetical protein